MAETFPLASWFDLSRAIPQAARHACEAEMTLRAVKDGVRPEELNREIETLRIAVKRHNAALRKTDKS